jgi:hypothetical protein
MDPVDSIAERVVHGYAEEFTRHACANAVISQSPTVQEAGQRLESMGLLQEDEDPDWFVRAVNHLLQQTVRCVRMMDWIKDLTRKIVSINFPRDPSVFQQVGLRLPCCGVPDGIPAGGVLLLCVHDGAGRAPEPLVLLGGGSRA